MMASIEMPGRVVGDLVDVEAEEDLIDLETGTTRRVGKIHGMSALNLQLSLNFTKKLYSGVPIVRTSTPDPDDEVSPRTSPPESIPVKRDAAPKLDDDTPKGTENGEKTADKSMAPPTATAEMKEQTTSKKRACDEEDGVDTQGAAKKVDVKAGES